MIEQKYKNRYKTLSTFKSHKNQNHNGLFKSMQRGEV